MPIRDATEADLAAIVEIYNASIPSRLATADTEPIAVESRLSWLKAHTPMTHPLWVMDRSGKVTGWLSFQPFYGRPAYHSTAEISIYVAPDYHRRGIARQLLQQAIAYSPAIGINTLLGFIFAHNEPSLKLFEKLNFSEWGYLPRVAELDGIERDVAILGLRIQF
jgi:L-amino acid N-acyltransferase YncA